MIRFIRRSACVFFLGYLAPLAGQSYVTAFDNVKYGRAAGPVTSFGSYVNVEPALGAVNLRVPLGPGIGTMGARYQPVYQWRISPNSGSFRPNLGFATRPMAFFNNAFARVMIPNGDDVTTPMDDLDCSVPDQGELADPWRDLLKSFGLNDKKAFLLGFPTIGRRTNNGYLVLPVLGKSGTLSLPISTTQLIEATIPSDRSCPRGLVVVSPDGETAYYYEFMGVQYRQGFLSDEILEIFGMRPTSELPPLDQHKKYGYEMADMSIFQLASINDRYGNKIIFSDESGDGDGNSGYFKSSGFIAKFNDGNNCSDSVEVHGGGVLYKDGTRYTGIKGASFGAVPPESARMTGQYIRSLDPNDPLVTIDGGYWDFNSDYWNEIDFPDGNSIKLAGVNNADPVVELVPMVDSIVYVYRVGQAATWGFYFARDIPIDPSRVDAPMTMIGSYENVFAPVKEALEYKPSLLSTINLPGRTLTFTWKCYEVPHPSQRYRSSHIWGVIRVEDEDTGTSQKRVTTYERTFPPQSSKYYYAVWNGNILKTTTTLPDSTKHVMEVAIQSVPGSNADNMLATGSMLTSSHPVLKEEVLGTDGRMISRTVYSCFTNRTDSWWNSFVPQPSHIEAMDYDLNTITITDKGSWDSNSGIWLENTTTIRAQNSSLSNTDTSTVPIVFQRKTTREMDPVPSLFLLRREKTQTTVRLQDVMGTYAGVFSGPQTESLIERTFTSAFNTLKTEKHQGMLTLFQWYASGAGMGAAKPNVVSLVGDGLLYSGNIGASYSYDSLGLMTSITRMGAAWNVGQLNDLFGRLSTRTDADGNVTTFHWDDPMHRITDVIPPSSMASTHIVYPDPLTMKVQVKGQSATQETQYKYTGFGQLASIDRPGGGYKRFTYFPDTGALKSESVWATEGSAGVATTSYEYDDRGRITKCTDPNGVVTATTYAGRTRKVQVGTLDTPSVTILENDPLGQLMSVKALDGPAGAVVSQVNYQYDLYGKLAVSTQTASGAVQTRTWTHNPLGWLTSRTDPETGTTTFQDFDANGNPWTTNLLGLDGKSTLVVKSTFDRLSRPLTTLSSDGLVDLAFGYDDAGAGAAVHGNGKRVWDRSGPVLRKMTYVSGSGLLGGLATTLTNVNPTFMQSFTYDSLGNRTTTVLDGRPIFYTFDPSTNLPVWTNYVFNPRVKTTFNPVDWTLTQMEWCNNGTSIGVKSNFDYDADRSRLVTMSHSFVTPSGWTPLQTSWAFHYDDSGRLTNDGQDAYTYDGLNRLTAADTQWKADLTATLRHTLHQTFQYDGFGNRFGVTSKDENSSTQGIPSSITSNYTYTVAGKAALSISNRLPSGSVAGPVYDVQGNLIQVNMVPGGGTNNDARTMTYDALGRVTSLFDMRTGANTTEKYFYSADGLRALIEEYQAGVLVRKRINIYNDLRQLVGQWVME